MRNLLKGNAGILISLLSCTVLFMGCESGSRGSTNKGSFPTNDVEVYEFVLRNAKSEEHGDYLLELCNRLLREQRRERSEDVYYLAKVDGKASYNGGVFAATVYNHSGYHLTEIVFKLNLFEREEQQRAYMEDVASNGKSSMQPTEIITIRVQEDHPNLSYYDYYSQIESPCDFFTWSMVKARGVEDPYHVY